ncbi:SPRY domain-containing SOCS box protein 3-like isoform X1 [Panonychus citri]|uniref:SPRY domain-containing SOCS box protein 3-like isoform X1 n=1 Tax=Panonychus citri TaxID=50023 RepID=UPI002307D262|nr:SPRY domain-containing SOCS box protein 3-like isoform X1 [Panonychus citri]
MDSMFCRPDHWTWSSKAKSREVKIFGKERRRIIFHPHWSNGTAGVRGNRILNSGHQECIYWEVRLPDRVFGTSMMFGIGTSKTRLQANMFTNLLGEDDQSWGLSHKGYIWHNGESRKFCKPFRENVKTTIGLLYDSCQGTLTYYKDGVKLGVAFRGLNQVSSSLYPLVSSTAAKTVMILCNLKVAYYCSTLKERCRYVILKNLTRSQDIEQLPLPFKLRDYLNHPLDTSINHDGQSTSSTLIEEDSVDIEMDEPKQSRDINESLLVKIYPIPDQWSPKQLKDHQLFIN